MKIDSYSFGEIVIDGKKFTNDVIIYPDRIESNWWRKEGHELNPEDITEIIKEKPDLLIIGTGSSGLIEVKEGTKKILKQNNIEFVSVKTEEACRIFNEKSNGKIIAALHLTC